MLLIIAIILNFAALYLVFHYFKWKITSYNFLESYEKRKEEIGEEINLMIIEINKTTERNLQVLEAKINQLNEVAARAEKVLNAFKKEKDITETSENIYRKLERKSINSKIEKAASPADAEQRKANKSNELFAAAPGAEPVFTGERKDTSPASPGKSIAEASVTGAPSNEDAAKAQKESLRDKVIGMYNNGIDIELISGKLGITTGEVELIISISKIK
ncbi:MAG: hypothetical protein FWC36_10455 [Spirochaetes bacterium]|nr:hypothetical protein [Spirochaetota bacterium]